MYPTQRAMVSGRIPESLENLKNDFESLAHDANMYKMQRDDYERKLQAQLGELSNIQQTLYDLERNHTKIKQQLEEEVIRLRRQLEMQVGGSGGTIVSGSTFPRSVSPAPPVPITTARDVRPQINASNPTDGKGMVNNNNGPSSMLYGGLAPLDSKRASFPSGPTPTPTVTTPTSTPKRPRETPDFHSPIPGQIPFPSMSQISEGNPTLKQHKAEKETLPAVQEVEREEKPPSKIPSAERIERRPMEGTSSSAGPSIDRIKGTEDGSADWIVGFNPGVQTNLNVDLMHTLEHSSVVCCVKFSNDGKWMATGCNKSAQIYDVETGEKIHVSAFTEESGKDGDLYIRSVCFSPDNRFLAAGAEDKTVKL